MQRSALCRSRRELSNAYLLAKIGVDTAEKEPLEVWGENSIHYSPHSLVFRLGAARCPESVFRPRDPPLTSRTQRRRCRAKTEFAQNVDEYLQRFKVWSVGDIDDISPDKFGLEAPVSYAELNFSCSATIQK